MRISPSQCPICGEALTVTRLHCRNCDTTIEGRFTAGPLAGLGPEQLDFVETFVRCEGKFTRMEGELGLSYPTLRSRLHDIIRDLGYEPGAEESPPTPDAEERQKILADLDAGRLSTDQALQMLKGEEQ